MELREYARIVWKWLWLIVLATAVAGYSAWWAVKDQPATYQTMTTLMVGQPLEQSGELWYTYAASQQLAQTYSELITREPILRAVAGALGFEDQWRRLKGQVAVSLVPGTQLLEIRVTDTDPARAKLIADEVARQVINKVEQARRPDSHQAFIKEQADSFPAKIEAALEEMARLEEELKEAFSARQIADIQSQINTLENQIQGWQATFAQYQTLLGDSGPNVLTVIEEAPLPTIPVSRSWLMQVALAGAIGCILAVGAAFLIEYLDDTLRTTEELEKVSGLPTLGVIAQIPGEGMAEKLVVALHPRNPISEAYRSLRTSLRYASPDRPLRSLVVTSPHAKEGKSTMLANLGVALAQAGQSVFLVDADLRRPMLHRIFSLPNQTGLTSALMGEELSLDGYLQETGIENLKLMTSGPLPPNPSELLGSQKMKRLMEQIEGEADMVLYDTPPLLPVTDGVVLAPRADGVLLIVESGRTRRGALQQALEQLRQVGANTVGVALNRVARRGLGGYYYYYYSMDPQRRRVKRRKRPRRPGDLVQEQREETSGPADASPEDMMVP